MNTVSETVCVSAMRRGGPQVLQVRKVPMPQPGPGDVRVRMLAAGVAFADIMLREGLYPVSLPWPRTTGYDIVGEIDATGPDVPPELPVGLRVAALTVHGSYARHRLLPAADCVPVPQGVDPVPAVALVLNYLTAYQMLHRVASLDAGDTVLIHAAAGGVGTAVLDLARLSGIRVIGLASKGKHELVRQLGGEPIDYRHEDIDVRVRELTGGRGVEAVLDAIGGKETQRAVRLIKPSGSVVSYGGLSMAKNGRMSLPGILRAVTGAKHSPIALLTQSKTVGGYNVKTWMDQRRAAYRNDLTQLMQWLAEGRIAPQIGERIPLEQAALAQQRLGEGRSTGKLVLV
ncbi:MAG: medium chain dehydrogenase/reductase family protein [Pseudomonadota bacterium]|nr:medium chain dehydrogenase/reductase family protein [Pseudomonadota bacterium]